MRIEHCSSRLPKAPRWAVFVCVGLLVLVGLTELLAWLKSRDAPPVCIVYRATGHPCPTCGSTRLVLAVLRGDLLEAFLYNPLVFAVFVAAGAWLVLRIGFKRRVVLITSARARRWWVVALVAAVLANWAYLWFALP